MPTNLERRVCALEDEISNGERTVTLTLNTGETYVLPHDFFKKFFAEERAPGSMALPIFHDPNWKEA